MTSDEERPQPRIEVSPATPEQEPILANLLELYAHDFSEFFDLQLGPDGSFGYSDLSLYWQQPGRHPFLVRRAGKLAGFVLVKRGSEISDNEAVWDMAEFFITRGCRRQGAGTETAHQVWSRFPGQWEVRVMESNGPARQFWERAIARFTGESIPPALVQKGSRRWHLFAFDSKPLA